VPEIMDGRASQVFVHQYSWESPYELYCVWATIIQILDINIDINIETTVAKRLYFAKGVGMISKPAIIVKITSITRELLNVSNKLYVKK
jgi:hypothetical protein